MQSRQFQCGSIVKHVACIQDRFNLAAAFSLEKSGIDVAPAGGEPLGGLVEQDGWTVASAVPDLLQMAQPIEVRGKPTGAPSSSAAAAAAKPLIVTFEKGKWVEEVTFNGIPSWLTLVRKVEDLYHDLEAEDFILKAGKLELSEVNWPGFAGARSSLTLGVISICKPFSSFKADDAFRVLGTDKKYAAEDAAQFPLADFSADAQADLLLRQSLNIQTHADIVAHAGKDLALRCCMTDPDRYTKEASKRELIAPVIFAAAALAGGVRVEEEYSVRGTVGRGMIDYAILYNYFSIIVLEGKLHETLEEHLGQLAAEIRSAREQYNRVYRSKRKHEDEGEFKEVPSFGILSNGTRYVFYKYSPQARSLIQLGVRAQLTQHISAADAATQVLPIIRHLVHIIQEQKEGMEQSKKAKTS